MRPQFLFALSMILLPALVSAQEPGSSKVKPYVSKAGRFSVSAPGKPQEQKQMVPTATGEVAMRVATFTAGTQVMMTSYSDYPASAVKKTDPEAMLAGSRDGFVKNVKGTLLNDKSIKLGKHPGRDFRVETEGGLLMRARIYLVGVRLYQVVAAGPKSEFDEANNGKFLNSFKLLGK